MVNLIYEIKDYYTKKESNMSTCRNSLASIFFKYATILFGDVREFYAVMLVVKFAVDTIIVNALLIKQ